AIPFAFVTSSVSEQPKVYTYTLNGARILKVQGLHYNLDPDPDAGFDPAYVVFEAAYIPTIFERVLVIRELQLEQIYSASGAPIVNFKSIEVALDRVVMMIQQLALQTRRSIKVNMLNEDFYGDIEMPAVTFNTVPYIDEDGNLVW